MHIEKKTVQQLHGVNNKIVKVIPLGGVEEIGINCTAIEYQDQIIVIDVGMGFPLSDQHGIDYLIPNIEYLKQNKHKIEGIIITHAHLDHIGGLPFVLKDLDFPNVYASDFSLELIKNRLSEFGFLEKAQLNRITRDSKLVSGNFKVEFFGVNHSIPESMGVVIRTPAGNIVHTGDFKFDNSPVNEPVAEYHKIAQIGSEGVLLLLSDSTNSFKSGYSKSESVIGQSLQRLVEKAPGRVVVATFSSLVTRLYQLISIAQKTNRRVAIIGRSMENSIKISRKLGYIQTQEELFVDRRKVSSLPENKVMVLATGAQGEDMAALARMTRGDHPNFKIKKGDTVILSASIIPGNDMLVQELIDELSQMGAIVYHAADQMDLHSSGHGYQEEQKLMLNMVRPKYFMPVHGYQGFLYKHAHTAMSVGIAEKNIIISKRGMIVEVSELGWKDAGRVKAVPMLVEGESTGELSSDIIGHRQQMANYGVVVIAVHLGGKTRQLISSPIVDARGLAFKDEEIKLEKMILKEAQDYIQSHLQRGMHVNDLREKLAAAIRKYTLAELEREPLIVPVVTIDSDK